MEYCVELEGTIYTTLYVEADSEEEAKEKAKEKAMYEVCDVNVDVRHEWNVNQITEWDPPK